MCLQLIEKGTTTFQLCFANLMKWKHLQLSTMVTCDTPPSKGNIILHCTNRQPSLSLIEKVAFFFLLKGHRMATIWTK
jgi:hypothetical protein